MSRVIGYLEAAWQGLGRYFEANKLVVLLFALLLAWWLTDRKPKENKTLFLYTLIMCLVLLFPVTAMFVMMYQTAYFAYEWAWSMVPLTVLLGYGGQQLLEPIKQKKKLTLGILGIAALFCLCGNQGTPLMVDVKEAAAQENTAELLQELYDFDVTKERILWAPKDIMEQVRRQDGRILLIYGRDMWDGKAGSYDYEVYSEALTNAYVWLEVLEEQAELAAIMADPATSFATLCEEEDLNRSRETYLSTVLEAGANVLVLPNLVAEHLEESIVQLAEVRQQTVKNAYTEEYTIYLLE